MVKHTSTPINAKAVVEGYTRTVTAFGTWSFTDQDEDEATGSTTATDTDENQLDKVVQPASSSGGVSMLAGDPLGKRTAQMALNCTAGRPAKALEKDARKLAVHVGDMTAHRQHTRNPTRHWRNT